MQAAPTASPQPTPRAQSRTSISLANWHLTSSAASCSQSLAGRARRGRRRHGWRGRCRWYGYESSRLEATGGGGRGRLGGADARDTTALDEEEATSRPLAGVGERVAQGSKPLPGGGDGAALRGGIQASAEGGYGDRAAGVAHSKGPFRACCSHSLAGRTRRGR